MADNGTAPHYSPDGRWWWDGATWVPVPQAPAPTPARRGGLILALGIVAAILVGLTLIDTVVYRLSGQQNRDRAAAYTTLTARDGVAIQKREKAVSVCLGKTDSIPACRDQLQALDDELASFQHDVDRQAVPPCLRTADVELRTALTDLRLGVQTLMQDGRPDTATFTDGLDSVSAGSAHLHEAATLRKAAAC